MSCIPSEPFVVSFWQLALPEITVPTDAYAATIARLRSSISRLDTWINTRTTTAEWVDAYRVNKTELSTLADKLSTEQEEQGKVVTTAAARLDVEKMYWFAGKCNKGLSSTRLIMLNGSFRHRKERTRTNEG